jgi:hypothetical protein
MGRLVITLSHRVLSHLGALLFLDSLIRAQGTIPALGENIPGPWNSGQGSNPAMGMPFWGNAFHNQWNPGQAAMPLPTGPAWNNPSQSPKNTMNAQNPMSFMGNQPMMSPQMQNPFTGQGQGFYPNPGQQPKFS